MSETRPHIGSPVLGSYRICVAAVFLAAPTAAAQAPSPPSTPEPPPAQRKDDRQLAAPGDAEDEPIGLGVLGVMRIDGKGRGFAGGAGLAISRGELELELMLLKSDALGGYLGLRYRLQAGWVRPYAAVGVPGFVFDHDELAPDGSAMTTRRLAVGVRAAAGIEIMINGHLSVQGDLGYEHFFFIDDRYEADVFVPTLGVIGRL
jgi:opacity protein-like surface antigen